MQLSKQSSEPIVARATAAWKARSGAVRGAAVSGVAAGLVSLAAGVGVSIPGTVMLAVLLPAGLGSIWGLVTYGEIRRLRASPTRRLDPADWARMVSSAIFTIAVIVTRFLPRMEPGSGFVMLGAALITSAAVCFWQLPRGVLEKRTTRERHPDHS